MFIYIGLLTFKFGDACQSEKKKKWQEKGKHVFSV